MMSISLKTQARQPLAAPARAAESTRTEEEQAQEQAPQAEAFSHRSRPSDGPGQAVRIGPAPVLLVFSHLRWGFVYQRPQHLLSRLAVGWRVLFVEEPVCSEGPARLERRELAAGLTVLVPHTPVKAAGFHDDQLAALERLLREELEARELHPDAAWLYTPMALPLAHALQVRRLVYDCMDELSAFQGAPRQLRQRESALLQEAALVLTGGPSLYAARRHLHANIHCFPSAVDAQHFSPARLDPGCVLARRAQALQGHLPRPRLGFFGVIDERMDLSLIELLARRHPDWALVMVGPVVKIDPASLPRHANIHWLGLQPYELLPYLLSGWDAALMPFALNASTRFISPTKTLEYMAGFRPVVSTPIDDVRSLYASAVAIAPAEDGFVEACEQLLAEGPRARGVRMLEMAKLVAKHSWHDTAEAVRLLLAQVVGQPSDSAASGAARARTPARANARVAC